MKLYRQYNKRLMRILAIVLPALMLNLIYTDSEENTKSYDKETSDCKTDINRQLYFIYTTTKGQLEEESNPLHFIKPNLRYYQHPGRFFSNEALLVKQALFNIIFVSFLLLNLIIKLFHKSKQLACHLGGHAPPKGLLYVG